MQEAFLIPSWMDLSVDVAFCRTLSTSRRSFRGLARGVGAFARYEAYLFLAPNLELCSNPEIQYEIFVLNHETRLYYRQRARNADMSIFEGGNGKPCSPEHLYC